MIKEIKLGTKMYSVLKGLADGSLEYKQLVSGTLEDKIKYLKKKDLEIVGVIVKNNIISLEEVNKNI